jgi:DCN1-like protein 1/2
MSTFSGGRKKQLAPRKPSTTPVNHVARDPAREKLSRIFDTYKGSPSPNKGCAGETDDGCADTVNTEDIINIEGTIRYFGDIALDPEEPAVLAVAYKLDAPTLGVFTRTGFVDGWRALGYVYLPTSPSFSLSNGFTDDDFRVENLQAMALAVAQLREQLITDNLFHKKVYLFTYAFARIEGQRSLRTYPPTITPLLESD